VQAARSRKATDGAIATGTPQVRPASRRSPMPRGCDTRERCTASTRDNTGRRVDVKDENGYECWRWRSRSVFHRSGTGRIMGWRGCRVTLVTRTNEGEDESFCRATIPYWHDGNAGRHSSGWARAGAAGPTKRRCMTGTASHGAKLGVGGADLLAGQRSLRPAKLHSSKARIAPWSEWSEPLDGFDGVRRSRNARYNCVEGRMTGRTHDALPEQR